MKEAHQVIGKHRLHVANSTIGIRYGHVYILNEDDISQRIWFLQDEDNIEWVQSFRQEHEVKDEKDVGYKFTAKTDWLLKRLLGLDWQTDSESFRRAYNAMPSAGQWVKNLHVAQERLKFWYSLGCPLNKDEISVLENWEKLDRFESAKSEFRYLTAVSIFNMRSKTKEMEKNESQQQSQKGSGS